MAQNQVSARSEIHRTVNGKKQIIQPGTVFVPQSPEEEAQLRKARAVRDPETGGMAAAAAPAQNDGLSVSPPPKPAAKPAKAKTAKAAKTAAKDPLKAENEAGGGSQTSNDAGSTGDADSGSGDEGNGDEGDGDDANLV